MAEVNRGEIWQFSFPAPDRRRPVLVLTRQEVIGHLHTVTVAPITTTIRGIPSEVRIGPESGLKTASAINLDHLASVPKAGLRTFVGTVSSQVLSEVREALLFALGFESVQGTRCPPVQVADRGYILEKGLVQFEGTMAAIWENEAILSKYLAVQPYLSRLPRGESEVRSRSIKQLARKRCEEVIYRILSHLNLLAPGGGPRSPPQGALSASSPPASSASPREWVYEPLSDLPVRRTQTGDCPWPDSAQAPHLPPRRRASS